MPGTARTEAPDVPMEAETPESSPQGEASELKVEPKTKDEHMGATEEANDETMAPEGSPQDEEPMPPDISPEKMTVFIIQASGEESGMSLTRRRSEQPQVPRKRTRRH